MTGFTLPIDIGNRALQHVGIGSEERIITWGPDGTGDDSKPRSEVFFCYDKLRLAELRDNVWRFAIRKAVLRPIDTTTRAVTFPTWNGATAYVQNFVVAYNGLLYFRKAAGTTATAPDVDFTNWSQYFGSTNAQPADITIGFYAGELVWSGSTVYLSLINDNTDAVPSSNWVTLTAATIAAINLIWPIGAGPSTQSQSRNVYQLPNGYLREAPQDPKAGSTSFLGAPSGRMYDDWTFEGNYFTTRDVEPITFRFIADIADVSLMDPEFCEALAARIGMETAEPLTQSSEKVNLCAQKYSRALDRAGTSNGIETGPTEPPEDDWITCRI